MRGRFHHLRRRRGHRQVDPCGAAGGAASRSLGIDVVLTREPGGSPGAEIIRHVLLSGAAKPLGAEAEAILFAAARDDHVRNTIEPALARGAWVICDRFIEFHPRLSGYARPGRSAVDPGAGAGHRRRPQARPHLHPRRAGGGRACARPQAPRRAATPTASRRNRWHFTRSCARPIRCWHVPSPTRCVLIDATEPKDAVAERIWKTCERAASIRRRAPALLAGVAS